MANKTTKHGACVGYRKTVEYGVWSSMIARCENADNPAYKNYGGRGISVCPEWRVNFSAFMKDMGRRPMAHTIERIDNNGNYEPDNVVWATRIQQQRNRRACRYITHAEITLTVVEWAEKLGLKPTTIYNRLHRGWPICDALIPKILAKGDR